MFTFLNIFGSQGEEKTEFGSKMDPTLYEAAMKGDIDGLIRYQDHFETQLTPKVNTVLHIAAMHGKTQGANRILQICPSLLDRVNSQRETPLHIAAREGHARIVQVLFDFVNLKNNETRLHAVIVQVLCHIFDQQNNDIEIGQFSWEMLGRKNMDGDTAFHMAVRNGHLDVVKLLLEKDSTFSYQPNIEKETPLYLAGKNGFHEIVSEILTTCTSPLYGGPKGRTVLHAAVIFDSRECTTKLLNWRRSLAREADVDGWTPLHHAAYHGHAQLVKDFLVVDKSVAYLTSSKNDGKNTALHKAASQGHVNVIEVLLSSCPYIWEIDNIKGQNILHIAVENKKDNVVEYIKKNSSLNGLINQKDNAGKTCAPTDVPNTKTAPNEGIEALRKKADTHMIVAALIATMTFTAGLTVPGGFYGNDDPNPGMAILIKNAAFKTFTFANTGALALSVVAILCYFDAASYNDNATLTKTYKMAGLIVAQALTTMMIAFVTGVYAVLANSLFLAITNCVLGCIVVLISYAYFIGCWSGRIDGVFPEVLAYIFKLFRADN